MLLLGKRHTTTTTAATMFDVHSVALIATLSQGFTIRSLNQSVSLHTASVWKNLLQAIIVKLKKEVTL